MARVLVIRLSSLGDVAMLVPAVCSVAARYPQDRFTVLTRAAYAPLFKDLGFNINVITFNPKIHGGVGGFLRLFKRILGAGFTHVADEHDVLRSKVLRSLLRLSGRKLAYIDKGKDEKELFIKEKTIESPIKSSTERYLEVFAKLGFPAEYMFSNFFTFSNRDFYLLKNVVDEDVKTGKWIGIAPFAKHETKIYPLEKMENIVRRLSSDRNNRIFLFGSRNDQEILDSWCSRYPNVTSVVGKFSLSVEMLLMSYLDVMISMDSANMHLASLVEVPVVSIWGGTHPYMGFYDVNQSFDNAVYEPIDCRPCSIYGNTPCSRTDDKLACMNRLSENKILEKVRLVLNQ